MTRMSKLRTAIRRASIILSGLFLISAVTAAGVYLYLAPRLPSPEILKDVRFQVPLRVYTSEGDLIAEFGEKKRSPVKYQDIPDLMVKALISAEDDRFFEHPGVDYHGLLRASWILLLTGEKSQGGSTITMQVARNFFLSREKTYARKINEILLALKIERELSKEDILELYLNKIYFGNRAYGVATAAQVYYGKPLAELTLSQMAMIVGLPKAPSSYNPIANAKRAKLRRDYVLGRMHSLGFIDDETYELALAEPLTAELHRLNIETEAPYVAEMVRKEIVSRYGDDAYNAGYKVYTTLESSLQNAANAALRQALIEYDQRHGYRGPIQHLAWAINAGPTDWTEALNKIPKIATLLPGLVISLTEQTASVYLSTTQVVEIPWEGMSWARPYIDENRRGPKPKKPEDILRVGDVITVLALPSDQWQLSQVPAVSAGLVSLNPHNGAIKALVGGYDFFQSKYNRITQAQRQPGSSFKPFIYSAALEKGYTAASLINDAPVVFEDPGLEAEWRPENYSGKFFGPTRLREALVRSRNLVSIRLLRAIGIDYTIGHARNFGFEAEKLPRNLSLALGSGSITPLELARAHAVFANGGYLIDTFFIERIEDAIRNVIMKAQPTQVCPDCEPSSETHVEAATETQASLAQNEDLSELTQKVSPAPRVISAQNAYIMNSIMRDVVRRGTGRRAMKLGRTDLAGKTGTTNDQRDAWFVGFNADLVAISWVGFDGAQPLGNRETGGRAALPMWMYFMERALNGKPSRQLEQPPRLVTVRIDPETGLRASSDTPNAIFETFRTEQVPKQRVDAHRIPRTNGSQTGPTRVPEQLF